MGIKYPAQLNDYKLLLIYRAYFDDALGDTGARPGHLALDGIGNARTAVMVADTLFRDGSSDGANLIHQALDHISGIDRRYQGEIGRTDHHPYVGHSSYGAIQMLVRQGRANDFLQALANARTEAYKYAMEHGPNKNHYGPGDVARVNHLSGRPQAKVLVGRRSPR